MNFLQCVNDCRVNIIDLIFFTLTVNLFHAGDRVSSRYFAICLHVSRKTYDISSLCPRKFHAKKSRDFRNSTIFNVSDHNISLSVQYVISSIHFLSFQRQNDFAGAILNFLYASFLCIFVEPTCSEQDIVATTSPWCLWVCLPVCPSV